MKSLVITQFVPTPPTNGGRLRSLAIIDFLAERGPVTVCAFSDESDDAGVLEDRGVRVVRVPWRPHWISSTLRAPFKHGVSTARFWSSELVAAIKQEVGDETFDHLQVEQTQMVPYAGLVRAQRKVLDMHNVESELISSRAANSLLARPALWLEAKFLARAERRVRHQFDAIVMVSELERQRLPGRGGNVIVCPNGWTPSPSLPPAAAPVAAYVGLLGWYPNADAATWLANEIWPSVRHRVPEARLLLVGRDPTPEVEALATNDVVVTGTVPDVTPYLEEALVAMAPLRVGAGSRLKILEALGAGRPVVATPLGAEGFEDLVGRGVVIGRTAAELSSALVELLADPEQAVALGQRGRQAVVDHYSWSSTLSELAEFTV